MVVHDALEIVASARPGSCTTGPRLAAGATIQRPTLGLPMRLKWLMGRLSVYICWFLKKIKKYIF